MDRRELEGYILDTYGMEPDYPWKDQPDYAVFRHPANHKWFALIMRIPATRLLFKAAPRLTCGTPTEHPRQGPHC